jgi:glycosyltransferase involved in cell wall biosynthesis
VRPARLVHLNTERGWRGGEIQTLLLFRGLAGRGHQCLLVAPPDSPLAARSAEQHIPLQTVSARGEFDLPAAWTLAGILRRFQPDLVHYHTSHAITLGTLASYRAGRIPAVASRRVSFPLSRNPLAAWKYTHRVDRVIAVSEGIRNNLVTAGVPRERLDIIHSAVDLSRFRSLPEREAVRRKLGYPGQEFLVGAVGHLARHKGHAVLVEAARRLVLEGGEFRFLLVGQGEQEEALRRQIIESNLAGLFRLEGFAAEVAEILPGLDLLVFPSLSGEGSPAVLKEAMACGIPIVASSISGVEEVVRHGQEGILVEPGDAAALAAAIRRVASDRSLGIECARRGRERVQGFGVESMVESTERVYGKLLEEHRP